MIPWTAHALQQILQRGLDEAWVELTLAQPDWEEADPRHPARRRAYRNIPERDRRSLRVIYEMDGAAAVIVSAFLDRTAPRRRPQ
jgi:hypothetical protein